MPYPSDAPTPGAPTSRRWAARIGAVVAALIVLAGIVVGSLSDDSDIATGQPARPLAVHLGLHRPNVVFVLTDDLSTDLVQYMPHVQALMKRGMTFTNYTVSDSLCCPSRSTIFTGEFPHNTGVFKNEGPDGGFDAFHRKGNELHTFATALRDVGYRTAMMGKYLNGYHPVLPVRRTDGTLERDFIPPGWTEWDSTDAGYGAYNYKLNQNGTIVAHGSKPADYLNTVLQQRAGHFIDDSVGAGAPFLLELATFTPHKPYVAAPSDIGRMPHVLAPRTPAFNRLPRSPVQWERRIPKLDAAGVAFVDHVQEQRAESVQSVDRMIAALQKDLSAKGVLDNTMFVFSSDNGYHLGQYHLRPGKLTAFDTDVNVPLVIAGPGVPAGSTSAALAQNIDLAPTFEQWGDAPILPHTDGRSLVPLLTGKPAPWRQFALVEHHGPDTAASDPDRQAPPSGNPPSYVALRGNGWTFVTYVDGEHEYYDRRVDPYETRNIAATLSPQRVSQLDDAAQRMTGCVASTCWTDAARAP